MKRMSRRAVPSPAMVVAFAALLVALGGSAYAAVKLPARSVGTKELKRSAVGLAQLKRSAIDSSKIKDGAVTGADVANDALTGEDVNEATLGIVPSATRATTVGNADHATASAGLDRVVYRAAVGSVPAAAPSGTEPAKATGTATCDPGQLVAGGGVRVDDPDVMSTVDSYPDGGGRSWTAHVANDDTAAARPFSVFAVCVPATAPG